MRTKSLQFLIFIALLATACQPSAPSPISPTQPTLASPLLTERQITILEIVNDVKSRPSAAADFMPVSEGTLLTPQGEVQSGEQSSARFDISPDGTILRIGANTLLRLAELVPPDQTPYTRMELFFGEIWVLLRGGSLDVETANGIASVRGSLLNIRFDQQASALSVTCLEGSCVLSNDYGSVQLHDGQAAEIEGPNHPPSPPRPMTPAEIQDWAENIPEALPYIPPELIPTPILQTPGAMDHLLPPVKIEAFNGCDSGQLWGAEGTWQLNFTRQADEYGPADQYAYSIAYGDTLSIDLPGGTYQVTSLSPDGLTESSIIDAATTIDRCPKIPDDAQIPDSSVPATYILTNPCDITWHWVFEGPAHIEIEVAPYSSLTGTLEPIGTYTAIDWLKDSGEIHTTNPIAPGGTLIVSATCPK